MVLEPHHISAGQHERSPDDAGTNLVLVPDRTLERLLADQPVRGSNDQYVEQRSHWIKDIRDNAERVPCLLLVVTVRERRRSCGDG
ncbi:MAG: hypothetical protein ACJAYI_000815 [Myxococcota bacterium]|jgi:hypothetical protein